MSLHAETLDAVWHQARSEASMGPRAFTRGNRILVTPCSSGIKSIDREHPIHLEYLYKSNTFFNHHFLFIFNSLYDASARRVSGTISPLADQIVKEHLKPHTT